MAQQIDAIFDNGVLRPLVPLHIPDQTRVKITVEAPADTESSEKLMAQQRVLRVLWDEIDKLPQHRNNDGWSVREHDELLYGGRK